ncbi:hypothetical protein Pint_02313 [Pistacia integerrima]|uniref:Uncharacterized protein n=1 Tax=Pistacia integerrima TaxID=434235 RepID=A0ACC0ZHA6_9ROSI|nr:hypothetical protein Pint_02313 [Pistacia integerrima]
MATPPPFPAFCTATVAEDAVVHALRSANYNCYSPTTGDLPARRTATVAEDAVVDALRSANHNCYSPAVGVLPARRAIADNLNCDLPYKVSTDDVYLTAGGKQAIEVILAVLARPGANILLPRTSDPFYEDFASHLNLEFRHFDLLPEKNWEVDLDAMEALADENTLAMVIINPGNPCGNVFTYQHLQKIAVTARKLGIMVISDEVYENITFGTTPYVRMGVFGPMVPVLTLGSLSKRWIVPGWRLGWLVTCDPNGILQKLGGAVPQILENTKEDFFSKIICILGEAVDICCNRIEEIPCLTCPKKPEGSMFVMVEVKLNPSLLENINDDMEFSLKLAKEESVIVLPAFSAILKANNGKWA